MHDRQAIQLYAKSCAGSGTIDSLSHSGQRHPKVGKHMAMSCATEAVRVSLPSKSGATDGAEIVNAKDERAELVPRAKFY
jgi:hypothetical protein